MRSRPQARQLDVVEAAQGALVERDAAGGGAIEAGEQVQQRGLAGAGRTDDRGDLAGGRLERYVAKHVDAGAGIADAVEEIVRDDSRHAGNFPTGPGSAKDG